MPCMTPYKNQCSGTELCLSPPAINSLSAPSSSPTSQLTSFFHKEPKIMADYDRDSVYSIDYNTDLDLSFTSVASTTTTDKTFASTSSARSSLARSSLTLSFNERLSLSFNDRLSLSFNDRLPSTSAKPNHHHHHHLLCRPHRRWDPHWSAIRAAINMSFDGRLHLRHLKLLRHLGTGNLGRVFLCRIRDYHHSNPHAHFALKVVDKESLTPKKLAHVETEAKILSTLDHPFLPTLYAHIDVSHYTCLLIDYCSGGDLHFLLRKQPNYRLPLYAVRFYAAEVLVALEYLHAKGIVYRDLKPENILLREDGHIMLSDFDLCFTSEVTARIESFETVVGATRRRRSNESCGCLGAERRRRRRMRRSSGNVAGPEDCVVEPTAAFSKSCVGTHEYLAPELIAGNGHSNGVDWWAFGVLIYELMYGTTPFKGINKDATLRNIASTKEAVFPRAEEMMEEEGTAEAKDLIRRLLVKDSRRRLGCARGAAEIKRHPFFDGVKWPLIRSYRPPEVRGGMVRKRKGKNQAGHHVISSGAIGFLKRRRWLWRRLTHFLKSKGSKANNVGFNSGPKLKKIGPSR